ncbi:MAG: hypothetical protein HRT94_08635 [Alphaproteobacteria bacterium]|nr:hypothetical protein [Alphaproteobacteria bacterium]
MDIVRKERDKFDIALIGFLDNITFFPEDYNVDIIKRISSNNGFINIKPELENTLKRIESYKSIAKIDLQAFSFETINNLNITTMEIFKIFSQLKNFTSNLQNPRSGLTPEETERRSALTQLFFEKYNRFINATEILEPIKLKKVFESKLIEEQANNIKESYADQYETNMNAHEKQATGWLIVGVFLLMEFFLFSFHEMLEIKELLKENINSKNFNNYKDFISYYAPIKIFLSAIILGVIFWVLRNFKVNNHHKILNRDKKHALESYQHLIEAAGTDIEMKKMILNKVGSTLYDHRDTGYINENSINDNDGIFERFSNLLSHFLAKK